MTYLSKRYGVEACISQPQTKESRRHNPPRFKRDRARQTLPPMGAEMIWEHVRGSTSKALVGDLRKNFVGKSETVDLP